MLFELAGRAGIAAICLISIAAILVSPIKMGRDANKSIPIIAELEQMSQEYCTTTFKRATAAYVVAKTIDKIVSTIQKTELTFTPFGVGLKVAPGEMLAAVNDAIGRFCAAFFWVIGITLLGQLAAGMMTFVCIKVLFPASLLLFVFYCISPRHFLWAKNLGILFTKIAIITFLFFPTVATVASYVDKAYLSSEYVKHMKELNEDEAKLVQAETDVVTMPEQQPEQSKSWWGKTVDSIKLLSIGTIKKALADKIDKIITQVDIILDKLFALLVIFLLTTCVIPVAILLLMIAVVRVFTEQYRQAEQIRTLREVYENTISAVEADK